MGNKLLEIVKEMASKEKKLKEYKRRIHVKGMIIEKKETDKGNIKLKVKEGEDKFNFIIIKSHKERYELALRLKEKDYISATGIPKFRYILCTKLKKIKKIEKQSSLKDYPLS